MFNKRNTYWGITILEYIPISSPLIWEEKDNSQKIALINLVSSWRYILILSTGLSLKNGQKRLSIKHKKTTTLRVSLEAPYPTVSRVGWLSSYGS